MNRASTRHVGLGIAGALVTSTRDVAKLSLWAARAGSRTPLGAPLRGPVRRLLGDAEHRGALNEARLLSYAEHIAAEWFERALEKAVQQGAGTSAADPVDGVGVVELSISAPMSGRAQSCPIRSMQTATANSSASSSPAATSIP